MRTPLYTGHLLGPQGVHNKRGSTVFFMHISVCVCVCRCVSMCSVMCVCVRYGKVYITDSKHGLETALNKVSRSHTNTFSQGDYMATY